ncbi:MFS general substrate transporter [Exidia glandulosa HHB12029]|uniref:MFS general substrate transporter n=1 Tax=Exidia glandulosa HHB12029 TaxID=1314781 RepID=A0A165LLZ5_EXIGL|nr:MFS general substrate transporter [Exidia glandulosa HHB12029]
MATAALDPKDVKIGPGNVDFASPDAVTPVVTPDVPNDDSVDEVQDGELKLPRMASLVVILLDNLLLQISFFIIVSSSNVYAELLGGDATFSGIVIGIPTVFSGIALLPVMRYDKGGYKLPLHISCATSILGHIFYALAYRFNQLYLILLGRIVGGVAFVMFMYCKRYCSDPRFVGIRRRTTLASWVVLTQGAGMTVGPALGGLLFKVAGGAGNGGGRVWNGLTAPGWVMAVVWALFWALATWLYKDEPTVTAPSPTPTPETVDEIELTALPEGLTHRLNASAPAAGEQLQVEATTPSRSASPTLPPPPRRSYAVAALMCWCAMTCFFVLGAWEANIPVFTANGASANGTQAGDEQSGLHLSPTGAGNFIALGGVIAAPLLLLNVSFAKRLQDRYILALGTGVGAAGLLVFLGVLGSGIQVGFAPLLVCWSAVALGFNVASTVTLSLMSKTLPDVVRVRGKAINLSARTSLAVQYSNYTGRVCGAIWGGSGVGVGMLPYVGLELGIVGVVALGSWGLWKDMKAKTG